MRLLRQIIAQAGRTGNIGVRGGFYLERRPWLGVALDVFHYKVFAETDRTVRVEGNLGSMPFDGLLPMDTLVQQYDVANGINMFLVNVMGPQTFQAIGPFLAGRLSGSGYVPMATPLATEQLALDLTAPDLDRP